MASAPALRDSPASAANGYTSAATRTPPISPVRRSGASRPSREKVRRGTSPRYDKPTQPPREAGDCGRHDLRGGTAGLAFHRDAGPAARPVGPPGNGPAEPPPARL